MKKLFFVVFLLTCAVGILSAEQGGLEKFNSQDQLFFEPDIDISKMVDDMAKGEKPEKLPTFAPAADKEQAAKSSARATYALYPYDTYQTDDLVGTAGNGIRDNLMVATPAKVSDCLRPDAGTPVQNLDEGILFVSSTTFKDNMAAKPAPLNMFQFRNVFSPNNNTSIKNTVPYSYSYTSPTQMYFVYYHNYLPVQLRMGTLHTDGAGFAEGNPTQSNIIGCYSLRYDGQDTSRPTKYYWLSIHRTQIYKDVLFLIETTHHRNILAPMEVRKLLHIVRQGATTNWQPYIDALLGK